MNKRFFFEAAALIVAAVLCALVSNALAARERKLALVGYYPNAQRVPTPQSEVPGPATVAPAPVTNTIAPTTTTVTTTTPATPQPSPATQKPSNPVTPAIKATTTELGSSASPGPRQFQAHPDKPYLEIAYADVNQLHNSNTLFLDARRTSVYEQGHIAGARPFSVWESDIDDKVRKLFDERQDPAQQALPIVVYCSGGECEDSHMLAQKLWGIQFNNVYVYKDGYPDWVAHRGATHTGPNP
jgi:rhodanese-related sulfurtransferase